MPGTIEISNLRNIQKLVFEIPDRGVWLLTAANGAGKTSLLACLRRIGHSNAFPVHFPSSLRSPRLDNHQTGTVTYRVNKDQVEYAYRGERWTPRPRRSSHLFKKFGYPSVTYVGATADRITPRPEDFDTSRIRAASKDIIDGANTIFETEKFSDLRTINLSPGVGNDAFVLSLGGSPTTYHSEKHFSLGELCVLKLLRLLKDVSNNSMIIVDELEMALHPRAQVNLLRHLQDQATQKSLTVIFSTHSVTLLKAIDRKKIIYLEKEDDGEIRPVIGCYPTYAIGNIASDEETLPDIMIYVEDVFARDFMTAFFELFADEKFNDPTLRPTAKIVPVGGFNEVVNFLDRNRSVLPDTVRQCAVLDDDVASETLDKLKQGKKYAALAKFQNLEKSISYLPFTPEVALMKHATENLSSFEQALRLRCKDNQLRIGAIVRRYNTSLQGGALRAEAKARTKELLDLLTERTQVSEEVARERLSDVYATAAWPLQKPAFMSLFGAML